MRHIFGTFTRQKQKPGANAISCVLQIFISLYNGRQKKWKMNLTNDKKTQIREHTWHVHLSMYKFTFFIHEFFDRCCKSSLGRWKWNRSWHKWTRRMSLVLKSFINNLFIIKSNNLSCDCLIKSTSRPYNNIGIHFVDTSCRITSSDAICPIFPKILLNAW